MSEYLNKQHYVTKSKKATQVKPHEYGTSSEDLFLPTLRKPNLTSDLLKNENYLRISDDQSVQEMWIISQKFREFSFAAEFNVEYFEISYGSS